MRAKQAPPVVIEHNVYAERALRVRALLQARDESEAKIAAILREGLDELGEAKWLEWCEKEFGWARRTAYRHLNPEQMEKDREDYRARAESRHIAPIPMSGSVRHEYPSRLHEITEKPVGPRWQPDPLTEALSDLARLTRETPAAEIVARMRGQHAAGTGFDRELVDELIRVRSWIETLISGIEPLVVTCETPYERKTK